MEAQFRCDTEASEALAKFIDAEVVADEKVIEAQRKCDIDAS